MDLSNKAIAKEPDKDKPIEPEPKKNAPAAPSTETLAARHDIARSLLERGARAAKHALALDLLEKVHEPVGEYPYRGWETLYREQWKYDSFGRTTHSINCTGSCTWKVYVRNNIAFKEEQYADYPDINPALPTYNPRGCQKGANYKEYVYGPQRVKYPLIRTGKRGEGKWRRASWDEAMSYIADRIVSAISDYGPDTVTFYSANPAKFLVSYAAGARLANLIGGVVCSFYEWVSDLPPGEPMTWGVQTDSCEAADWFNSKYILIWGSNLLETRIPDAHFVTAARMHGTKIVAIFPEYNPVSIHADIFIPVKPGTDGALALGMANVIVNEKLYDENYLKQFTDLPVLVRIDNGKFLRESDVVSGGETRNFYFRDESTGKPQLAPGTIGCQDRTLELGAINPSLEGTFMADTLTGKVEVTTVFSLLKKKLEDYDPASVSGITGVDAGLITLIAREFASTKPARIIAGAGVNHYYHNDLINRSMILLAALTGNVGIPGGGFDHYVGQEKFWCEEGFFKLAYPLGNTKQRFQPTTLWTYVHSNIEGDQEGRDLWPRPIGEYIRESVEKGWMPLYPGGTLDSGKTPRVLIVWGANYLNQAKGAEHILANLWPKLDLIVDIDFRMNTTGLYSDVILPSSSMFEKWDLSTTDLHSYITPLTPIIPPQLDSRTDWQIFLHLARALSDTKFSYTDTLPDGSKISRDFSTLENDFTSNGTLAQDKSAGQFILDNSVETKGMTMDMLDHQPGRYAATGEGWTSDIKKEEAYHAFQRMYELKLPLNTLTGRQQFYIDHDWFLREFHEELPVYKPPVDGTKYPLRFLTPHGRWSIHSLWRDAKYQLRLQRGYPIVYLNPDDAAARGLSDNDPVEIYNDNGTIIANLCISPRMPQGLAMMYQGWERYNFKKGGFQSPTTIRIKPTQLAGNYGQLKFKVNYWGPTGNQKDTRVEIRKFMEAE
ncbi:Respiratory nitrate reductase subunit alpha [uncultured archaeon]|nr:Respiratory nitrate reductase subunit alpha [uncultured archaeon]